MNNFTRTLLVTLSAATLAVSCKKDDKKADESNPAPAATKTTASATEPAKTPEEPEQVDLGEVFKMCWAAYNARDEGAMSQCYGVNSELTLVDFVPPTSGKGAAEILPIIKNAWARSSDEKSEAQLVLRNGNNFAALLLRMGTNDGESMGQPATGKAYSYYSAQMASFGPDGKVATDRHWVDQGVVAHQLGLHVSERAPDSESAWPEAMWVTASDDDKEKANLEVVKAMSDAMMKGDIAGYMSHIADDVSFRYIGDKEPMNGMKAYKKGFEMWAAMADRKSEQTDLWAAGDWVVAVNDTTATMKMDMPGSKGTKGKDVTSTTVEFLQMADGKLKSHWVVENSMVYPVQLGLMDMAKKGEKPAKATKASK